MPSVDNRVVRMEFDNAAFERKVQGTITSLAQLDKALKMEGAAKGLAGIQDAAKGINLSSIAEGIDHIASRFSALGAVAFSVIQSITQGALGMAKKIGGDILEPIIGGGKKRALNLEQARFLFQGIGMDVEKGMASARKAVLGTAYGLDEAAKAAAQFGASGIDAGDEMFKTLRGVAGVAAMTNTSFSEMSDVFTQAAGAGKISGYTLQRIAMRGLNVAAALGKQMGKTESEIRDMASEGKISFKEFAVAMDDAFGAHAQEANQTYTGALANMRAALARLGAAFFTPQLQQQRDLFNALTPIIDNVKEALMPLIDAFNFLTTLSTAKLVKGLKAIDLTNLKKAMPLITKGFVNIWVALDKIKNIAKAAFKDIFPPTTVSFLMKFSQGFLEFTKHLTVAGKTAENIKSIFKGFFSILSIGWEIIKEGAKFLANLVQQILGLSSGGILSGLAKIGDFFTNLQKALVKGGGIKAFFEELTQLIQKPIQYLKDFRDALVGIFTGFDPKVGDAVSGSVGRISDRLSTMKSAFDRLKDIWQPFSTAMHKVIDVLDTIWGVIRDWFKELGQKIADTMEKGDFDAVLDALNVTLLGGIAALLTKWVKGGVSVDLTGGLLDKIGASFDQLTGILKSMQMQIKAEALIKIATAVGILTASMVVLSLIDSAALTKALLAMSVGFGQLIGAFALLQQLDSGIKSGATFDLVAGGMIALATAILILSGAVAILGKLDWGELARGLVGIGALLVLMVAASKPLSKAGPGLIIAGAGLTAVGIGLNIIGMALKLFATMSWGDMAKGLVGVAGALVAIALGMNMMPANLPLTGLGLIAVASALTILGGALKIFATMSWGDIGKSLVVMAGGLLLIAIAVNLMPATMPLIGAGLLLVAEAMVVMGGALLLMGSMSWGEIAKSLVAMAGALILLAAAAYAMEGALPGAAALAVMAVSLGILAGVMKDLAGLSWGDLLHAIVGIAAALAVLAIAALVLEPVIPAMLGLGAALLVIGAGFALFGVGAYAVAKALEAIAKSGAKAAEAIPKVLKAIGKSMGALGRGLAEGMIEMVMTIAKALPVLMKILGAFLEHLIDTIIKLIPKIKEAFMEFIDAAIEVIYEKAQPFIDAGIYLLMTFLTAIRDNIGEITTLVTEIITEFLNALTEHVDEIITAGMTLLTTFLQGIADNITLVADKVGDIITQFMFALAGQYMKILQAGTDIVTWFLQGVMSCLQQIIDAGVGIILGLIWGIGSSMTRIVNAATDVVVNFLTEMANNSKRIIDAGVTLIVTIIQGFTSAIDRIGPAVLGFILALIRQLGTYITQLSHAGVELLKQILTGLSKDIPEIANACLDFIINTLEGLRHAIDSHADELGEAGRHMVGAIINGMTGGIAGKMGEVASSLSGGLKGAVSSAKSAIKIIGDPYSVVFMGIGEAMCNGLTMALDTDTTVEDSAVGVVGRATEVFTNSLQTISQHLGDLEEFNPTITPVLDLTQVEADAQKISSYISSAPVATASLTQASRITADMNAAKSPDSTTATTTPGGVNFQQNIYAPEQLSTADIYKQTRNQITLAKEELSIP